jgi:drug/metabolite transporter (DMT)-like permease
MRWNFAVAALAASFGFVSIIVQHVDLSAEALVFYRCVFAVAALATALAVVGKLTALVARSNVYAVALGTTLGVHWLAFFETIKLSSVVVAVLAAYTAPILVALFAPFFLPERRSAVGVFALLPATVGLGLVALGGGEETDVRPLAIATGAATALTYAALIIGTKRVSARVSAAGLTFWNYTLSGLTAAPLLLVGGRIVPEAGELAYIVLLGVVFTAVSGYLYLWLIRRVTAQAMGLLAYLEPVSAAALAWLILDESLGARTLIGGTLVIAAGLLVVALERVDEPPLETVGATSALGSRQ